jgi:hypothetical protein
MAAQINLQPQVLDLLLYAGDGLSFRLICTNGTGAPVDITGGVRAQVRTNRFEDPPIATFGVNLIDSSIGVIVLSLTGEQTQDLVEHPSVSSAGKFTGVWDVEWDPADSEPRTLCQGKLECVADVSR